MSINPQAIKALKRQTGCSLVESKRALEACDGDYIVAYYYLKLKSSAVARYTIKNGKNIPFTEKDYVALAKETAAKRKD